VFIEDVTHLIIIAVLFQTIRPMAYIQYNQTYKSGWNTKHETQRKKNTQHDKTD